jgi:hypothetical protein
MVVNQLRRSKGIPVLFFIVFLLTATSLSHDFFCHDEIHTVCSPLHVSFLIIGPSPAQAVIPALEAARILWLPQEEDIISGFAGDIYHPPDPRLLP